VGFFVRKYQARSASKKWIPISYPNPEATDPEGKLRFTIEFLFD
jgi:hypothetical protein